jgi:DNA-binding NarL/FixJ family response regulator
VAELCKKLLEVEFEVVGIVGDGHTLLRAAAILKPDLIIIDIAMPVLNGLDAGQQVKELCPAVKLVYLTMNPDPEVAAEAFRRGGSAYLLKTCTGSELVIAVREALRGNSYMSRTIPRDAVSFLRRQDRQMANREDRLTERQHEVLKLVAEGKTMKEVGGILNISARTVAFHKHQIMGKLGTKSSAELVRYAIRNRIVAA